MTLLIALLLAATPAPQKPPTEGAALALDCSAYLSLALGEAETAGRVDEPLQGQFDAWVRAYGTWGGAIAADGWGQAMADRSVTLEKEKRKVRAARTAWCRANAPLEKSA